MVTNFTTFSSICSCISRVGVKIRNLKVNFKTGGTWHWAMITDNEYL